MTDEEMADHAAYSASQPLYDALKIAVERVEASRQMLEDAMLAVRNENVKTNSDKVLHGSAPQESYVDHSILAWRGLTTAFTTVFSELSSLSQPRLEEGRQERPGHHLIKTVLSTTKAAQHAACAMSIRGERRLKPIAKPHVRRPDYSNAAPNMTNKKRKLSINAREQGSSKVRCFETSQTLPSGSSHNIASKDMDEHLHSMHISPERPQQQAEGYTVQYEDVSAEVDARLAAREKRRTEKKGKSKRNRDSTQSLTMLDPDEKPAQKKVRRRSGGDGPVKQPGPTYHSKKRDSPQSNHGPNKRRKVV